MNSRLNGERRAARDKEIVRQYLRGMSTKRIGELWSLTPGRIVQILNERNIEFRSRRKLAA